MSDEKEAEVQEVWNLTDTLRTFIYEGEDYSKGLQWMNGILAKFRYLELKSIHVDYDSDVYESVVKIEISFIEEDGEVDYA